MSKCNAAKNQNSSLNFCEPVAHTLISLFSSFASLVLQATKNIVSYAQGSATTNLLTWRCKVETQRG